MMIEFDLNTNDLEALLRHCQSFKPVSGGTAEFGKNRTLS